MVTRCMLKALTQLILKPSIKAWLFRVAISQKHRTFPLWQMKTKVTELTVSRSSSCPPPQKTEAVEKTRGLSQVVETSPRHLLIDFVVLRVMNGFAEEDESTTPPPPDQWVRRPAQSGSVLLSAGIYKKWPDICHGCKKRRKKFAAHAKRHAERGALNKPRRVTCRPELRGISALRTKVMRPPPPTGTIRPRCCR